MCWALRIPWLKKTNKVPNPQGAYILMWKTEMLNKSTSVFEVVTNVLKNKVRHGCEGCLGYVTAVLDSVVKDGFSEEVMSSLRPK